MPALARNGVIMSRFGATMSAVPKGLALASFDMFSGGAFATQKHYGAETVKKLRADGAELAQLSTRNIK